MEPDAEFPAARTPEVSAKPAGDTVTPFAVAATDVATVAPAAFLPPRTIAVSPGLRLDLPAFAVRVYFVAAPSLTLTIAPVEDVR